MHMYNYTHTAHVGTQMTLYTHRHRHRHILTVTSWHSRKHTRLSVTLACRERDNTKTVTRHSEWDRHSSQLFYPQWLLYGPSLSEVSLVWLQRTGHCTPGLAGQQPTTTTAAGHTSPSPELNKETKETKWSYSSGHSHRQHMLKTLLSVKCMWVRHKTPLCKGTFS